MNGWGGEVTPRTMQPLRSWLGEWDTAYRSNLVSLPGCGPRLPREQWCAELWRGWLCTRRTGHQGRCSSSDGTYIRAVWVKGHGRRNRSA